MIYSFAPAFLIVAMLGACAQKPYKETYDVTVRIVMLDQQQLKRAWETCSLSPSQSVEGFPLRERNVRAFYDYRRNTIYCEKWDFKNCGHELHHALFGPFHE